MRVFLLLVFLLPVGASAQLVQQGNSSPTTLYVTGAVVGNGADTTEDTLQSYTIPAGQLANVGDRLHIVAAGALTASTDTKTIRTKFGGTNLSAPVGNTTSFTKWQTEVWIIKTGSNTQSYSAMTVFQSVASQGSVATVGITDTSAIALLITGQNSTNSVANSITCQLLTVEYWKAPAS